jgi:hypothetical protein
MIQEDKIKHFLAGAGIVFISKLFGFSLGIGLLIAIAAGVFKEIWDYYHPETNTAESADTVATVFGAMITTLLLHWINYGY